MRRFFSRDDFSDLESELRNGRPEPRSELLDNLVARAASEPARTPVRRPRLAAALVFAVVVLVALAAFGGVGYAKSSFVSAAKSSEHAVSAVVNRGDTNKSGNNAQGNSNQGNNNQGNDGKNGGNSQGGSGSEGEHHEGGDPGHEHDPPWMHQYSHFVVICYPIPVFVHGHLVFVRRTIVIPRFFLPLFVGPGKPGTLGRCT